MYAKRYQISLIQYSITDAVLIIEKSIWPFVYVCISMKIPKTIRINFSILIFQIQSQYKNIYNVFLHIEENEEM